MSSCSRVLGLVDLLQWPRSLAKSRCRLEVENQVLRRRVKRPRRQISMRLRSFNAHRPTLVWLYRFC